MDKRDAKSALPPPPPPNPYLPTPPPQFSPAAPILPDRSPQSLPADPAARPPASWRRWEADSTADQGLSPAHCSVTRQSEARRSDFEMRGKEPVDTEARRLRGQLDQSGEARASPTLRPPYCPGGFWVANSMNLSCADTVSWVSGTNSSRLSSSNWNAQTTTSATKKGQFEADSHHLTNILKY